MMATIRKMALFPTSVGAKTIDPMSIEAQVRVRRTRDPFEDFFRGGGLFGTTVPTLIASNPVTVEVLPLPETGRPPDFSGFVGNVDVTARLDKTTAEVNEVLTFTLRVEGDGNIRTLPEFDIAFRGKMKEGLPVSIAYGIGIAFLYWIFYSFCVSLGYGEMLPPIIAAWTANFIFLAFAVFILLNAE